MRRLTFIAALLLGALAFGITSLAAADGEGETTRVDAIFDSSGFLVTDEEVRIAGAPVGTITDLSLTDDYKARVTMEIDSSFVPFREDADCTIQPQSLIGDRFVQCTPGTQDAPELEAGESEEAPTVPLENTHTPVDLDVVLSTFDEPTRDRLAIIFSTLGAGFAGRSEDLNELLRRSNPALGETAELLGEIEAERKTLGSLVDESDRILAELAGRKERVGEFVDATAEATAATAEKREQLRATIRNLPPLLRELEPSLDRVREIAREGEPILSDLDSSADSLDRLLIELPDFAREGEPALRALGRASRQGKSTVADARPQVRRLAKLTDSAEVTAPLLKVLLESSQEAGVLEGAQRFVYNAARTTGRYDSVSHLAGAYVFFSSLCTLVSPVPVPGCDAHWDSYEGPTSLRDGGAAARAQKGLAKQVAGGRNSIPLPGPQGSSGGGAGAGGEGEAPAPGAPAPGTPANPAPAPGAGNGNNRPLKDLLDYLLR